MQHTHSHTHTLVSWPFVRDYPGEPVPEVKTNLDLHEARDSKWQWHQLGHMWVCTSLQTDNHASTRPLSFFQARCPSCHPTDIIKALKARSGKKQHSGISIGRIPFLSPNQALKETQSTDPNHWPGVFHSYLPLASHSKNILMLM